MNQFGQLELVKMLPGFTEPPYKIMTSSSAPGYISFTVSRINLQISSAISVEAFLPVPIDQTGL